MLLEAARAGVSKEVATLCRELEARGCNQPEGLFEDLRRAGFFISRPDGVGVSTRGYKSLLFVEGALGGPSQEVLHELRMVEPSLNAYELVREGMTTRFIKGLLTEPGFQRLYLCSPWINLVKKDLRRLMVALDKAAQSLSREPEVLVLVQTPKLPQVRDTIDTLKSIGADVVEKPTLHSKLYMREPGPRGGLSLAIVGSENLTRPKWIELGIEIRNDSYLLSRLRSYFFDIYGSPAGE